MGLSYYTYSRRLVVAAEGPGVKLFTVTLASLANVVDMLPTRFYTMHFILKEFVWANKWKLGEYSEVQKSQFWDGTRLLSTDCCVGKLTLIIVHAIARVRSSRFTDSYRFLKYASPLHVTQALRTVGLNVDSVQQRNTSCFNVEYTCMIMITLKNIILRLCSFWWLFSKSLAAL